MQAFGFNHTQAIRFFLAQTLDPHCPMTFCGKAVSNNPNINVSMNGMAHMSADERAAAYCVLQMV